VVLTPYGPVTEPPATDGAMNATAGLLSGNTMSPYVTVFLVTVM
jgi:hypothetical protein